MNSSGNDNLKVSPKVSLKKTSLKMDAASVKRREQYLNMPEDKKERIRKRRRDAYHKDPERFRKYCLNWHEKNPNYIRDYYKEYYQTVGHDGGNSKRSKKVIIAHNIALQIPMEKYCEICPPDDLQLATMRHHMDYDYPTIFVSVCRGCHTSVHRDLKKQEQTLEVCVG